MSEPMTIEQLIEDGEGEWDTFPEDVVRDEVVTYKCKVPGDTVVNVPVQSEAKHWKILVDDVLFTLVLVSIEVPFGTIDKKALVTVKLRRAGQRTKQFLSIAESFLKRLARK